MPALARLIDVAGSRCTTYRNVVVQPGISRSKLTEKVGNVLADADPYVLKHWCMPLLVLGSQWRRMTKGEEQLREAIQQRYGRLHLGMHVTDGIDCTLLVHGAPVGANEL